MGAQSSAVACEIGECGAVQVSPVVCVDMRRWPGGDVLHELISVEYGRIANRVSGVVDVVVSATKERNKKDAGDSGEIAVAGHVERVEV
jgi:hypothetical protein